MVVNRNLSAVVGEGSELDGLIVLRNRLAYEIDELGSETGGSLALLPGLSKQLCDVLERIEAKGVCDGVKDSPLDELARRRRRNG